MKSAVKNSVLLVLAVALLPACRREARNENPDTPPAPSASVAPVVPAPTTSSTTDHAEVFRRAFWRQPAPADRILHAERRVSPDDGSWQWFIQLHPSPNLLAALRDPENLGLLPLGPPSPNSAPSPEPPPLWFPLHDSVAEFETLRSPATALTVFYRAADNMLFATDHGTAFAPPVRPR